MIFGFQKIILFIFSLAFIKAEFKVENLTLKNEITKFNKLFENKYYYITFNSSIPSYIKLLVKDNYFKTSKSDYIHYIISYYNKDKTFTERNQISHQSYKSIDFIILWLNYEQIKDGFYLSIESFNSTCNYSLEIYPYYEQELNPAEQYSYFVTKENKEMKFIITKKNFKLGKLEYFTIWAKGRKNIRTSFYGIRINNTSELDSNYSAYFIVIEDNEDYYGTFTIKANEGDYITLGTLVYKSGFKIDYYYDGIEYYGFLIKNLLTINCIPLAKLDGYKFLDYSHSFKEIDYTIYQSYPDTNNKACIDHNNNYNKIFYVLKTYSKKAISSPSFYKLYSICNSYNSSNKDCYIFQKLYSDEYNSDSSDLNIFSITKGSETNIFLESHQFYNYISIETLSGKIEIESLTTFSEEYSYNNIHSYIFIKGLFNNLIWLKIKGKKNSVYSIKLIKVSSQWKITDNNFGLNNIYIDLGENYLFNFPFYEYSVFKYLGNKNMYLSLYPIKCNVDIGYINNDEEIYAENINFTKLTLKNGFYQGLIYKENECRVYSKTTSPTCLIYGSVFLKENMTNFTNSFRRKI